MTSQASEEKKILSEKEIKKIVGILNSATFYTITEKYLGTFKSTLVEKDRKEIVLFFEQCLALSVSELDAIQKYLLKPIGFDYKFERKDNQDQQNADPQDASCSPNITQSELLSQGTVKTESKQPLTPIFEDLTKYQGKIYWPLNFNTVPVFLSHLLYKQAFTLLTELLSSNTKVLHPLFNATFVNDYHLRKQYYLALQAKLSTDYTHYLHLGVNPFLCVKKGCSPLSVAIMNNKDDKVIEKILQSNGIMNKDIGYAVYAAVVKNNVDALNKMRERVGNDAFLMSALLKAMPKGNSFSKLKGNVLDDTKTFLSSIENSVSAKTISKIGRVTTNEDLTKMYKN
jgi:hypothetical protein